MVVSIVLLLKIDRSNIANKYLQNIFLIWFGKISYPLYLLHWPLIVFSIAVYGDITHIINVYLLIVTIFLSFICYKFIEIPVRNRRNGLKVKQLILLIMLICGIGYLINLNKGYPLLRYGNDYYDKLKILHWDIDKTYSQKCKDKYFNGQFCLVNNINSRIDSVIIGDSQANTMYWGLSKYLEKNNSNLINIGVGGCFPFYNISGSAHENINFNCYENNKKIYDFIVAHDEIKTVYFAFYHSSYFRKGLKFHDEMNQITNINDEKNI